VVRSVLSAGFIVAGISGRATACGATPRPHRASAVHGKRLTRQDRVTVRGSLK
jgi:hypothetical protein